MQLYLALTNRTYELAFKPSRLQLRSDLQKAGFFLMGDNQKFWPVLDEAEDISEIKELMSSIKWYELRTTKEPTTEQN